MEDDGSLVKRLRDGLKLVSTVAQAFAEAMHDYHRLLPTIARNIAVAIPDICLVMLPSPEGFTIVALHDGKPGAEERLRDVVGRPYPQHDSVISSEVLMHGPVFLPRIDYATLRTQMAKSSVDQLEANNITGMLVVPLASRGEVLGVVWVLRLGDERPPLDRIDLEIIQDLANHAALAISNARLFQQLERSEQLRAAEERAVQASSLLDAIIENIPDMVFVKDAARLAFVRCNRATEELIGLSRAELLGKTDHDLFPSSEADFFTAKDREALVSGSLVDIPEEPIHTRHGVRWLHTKKVALHDSGGAPQYLLGISHDITERKRTIAELSAAKAAVEEVNRELESFSYSVAHDLRTPLRAIDGFSQALLERHAAQLDPKGSDYLRRVRSAAQRMG
ncbi:MAG TPA: PAS domain-containing protein, partial [Kofleriaceae bacterium]|nr:PAS domain-containing protein [Kofleriaceae bacterium]